MSGHTHCIGVAGIGMCGAAKLLLQQGHRVTGSDQGDVTHLTELEELGLELQREHAAANLGPDVERVVRSVAVPDSNPEVEEARRRGLPVLKYAEMVGDLMKSRRGLCVAGAHGKTTTSAMVTWVLREAGRDPGFIIGAHVPQLGGTSHAGSDRDFVLESCEFDRSFHHYKPHAAIVTNVDIDHLDYYADIHEIQDSFREFLKGVSGPVYMHGDDPYSQELIGPETITLGFSDQNRFRLVPCGPGQALIREKGKDMATLTLSVPGKHNLLDAGLAWLMCRDLGVPDQKIFEALATFSGAERRFQVLHEAPGYAVVDDYAHHPVEIQAVLESLAERWPGYRRIVIFQPHQHSRTRFLLDSFAWVLEKADLVLVPEIYFVRDSERDRQEVSSRDLVRAIRSRRGHAEFLPDLQEAVDRVAEFRSEPSVVVVMGAGDIFKLGQRLCP